MSISSSLYIGTTGIIAQQTNMSVISDNISNVSTVGFKSSRALFQSMLSEQLTGATVGNQIGQGASVSSVYRDMSVGTLEASTTATDIAIGGDGFFMVSPEGSEEIYYTRAGNFRFDKEDYLRDPHGNILQGYKMSSGTGEGGLPPAQTATLEDIRFERDDTGQAISAPEATSEIQMMLNLDSIASERSESVPSPYTALFDRWDATATEPLPASAYAYESTLNVYDATGASHQLIAYFDPASANVTDEVSGNRTWEYLVTMPPADDASGLAQKKGVLMAGTMTFSSAGELLNMSAFSGTADDKTTWTPAPLSADGHPMLQLSAVGSSPTQASVDFGLSTAADWDVPVGIASLADITASYATLPRMAFVDHSMLSTSNYATGVSVSLYQNQNGYTQGYLQSFNVNKEGVLIGNYSNGQNQDLFKIPLADFINPQGLFREGGNLFSASKDSGAGAVGWAGEGRFGAIAPSSLEGSNVDLATEFVNMISTQKAFDANSKVITTADQVIQTALGIKK